MHRNSAEEQREESWPSQPDEDLRHLKRKHIPLRAKPLRCGLQDQPITWELIRNESSRGQHRTCRLFGGRG